MHDVKTIHDMLNTIMIPLLERKQQLKGHAGAMRSFRRLEASMNISALIEALQEAAAEIYAEVGRFC